ncbi:MAG TPA: efflux RND transporter periplasmic adaptor subunit [Terriglobia bacterium]|nr:efflux RND transporter periplasmic adaptor subunit [Terriglobia bacterium]
MQQPFASPTSQSSGRGKAIAALGKGLFLLALLGGGPSTALAESFLGQVAPLPGAVAEVTSPATGVMIPAREKPYTVGDRVKKGEPLLVIANRYDLHDASHISNIRWDFLQAMMEARYAALEARIAREKGERLKNLGAISGQQLAALRAAEQVAQAEYLRRKDLLEQQDEQIRGDTLERRGLVAPIDGQIALANFTQGQMVYEGFLLYRIVDLRQVAVAARVPEASFRPWPEGTPARIRFDDLPGREFTGRLLRTLPLVDPQSRVREVLFRVDNPEELLRFGMIGHVEVGEP